MEAAFLAGAVVGGGLVGLAVLLARGKAAPVTVTVENYVTLMEADDEDEDEEEDEAEFWKDGRENPLGPAG